MCLYFYTEMSYYSSCIYWLYDYQLYQDVLPHVSSTGCYGL
ncbi:unnamed protein product, partial [Callosobruchus maculatus]